MKIQHGGEVIELPDPELPAGEAERRQTAVAARRQAKAAEISAADFYNRFTDAEKLAVQTAAQSNAQIALGLTHGLVKGTVTLTGATVGGWMDGLVSAGAITAQRKTEILTP